MGESVCKRLEKLNKENKLKEILNKKERKPKRKFDSSNENPSFKPPKGRVQTGSEKLRRSSSKQQKLQSKLQPQQKQQQQTVSVSPKETVSKE